MRGRGRGAAAKFRRRFGAFGSKVEEAARARPSAMVAGAGGWIVGALTALAKGDRTVGLRTPGRVHVVNGPLHLAHKSAVEIIEAARNAVKGGSDLIHSAGTMPAAPGDYTDDIQGEFFGVVLTVSDAPTEHSYGLFTFDFGFKRDLAAAGVDDVQIIVRSPEPSFEVVLLSTSDNGGIGSVAESTRINFQCLEAINPTRPSGTHFALQGLNLRDIEHLQL